MIEAAIYGLASAAGYVLAMVVVLRVFSNTDEDDR